MKTKGMVKTGGRKPNTPNKTTSELRSAINLLVSNNADEMQNLLNRVGAVNPGKALEILIRLAELILPKPVEPSVEQPKTDWYAEQARRIMQNIKD